MTEFKQIIGRGTRLRDDYGKLFFNIIDYTGSATRLFADPDFDGDPARITVEEIDESGETTSEEVVEDTPPDPEENPRDEIADDEPTERRKFYFDGGRVEIGTYLVYDIDPNGRQLRCVLYTDYTAERVRTLFANAAELRANWVDLDKRSELIAQLNEHGIDFEQLQTVCKLPDADPLDLLCHLAYNAPLRTRRERAERLRRERKDFFEQFGPKAKQILESLLEKYAEHGAAQFEIPDVLKVPPISGQGNVVEIVDLFGGPDKLRRAVLELQRMLYVA